MTQSILYSMILGTLQGLFEWLPISSEGNLTVILAALGQQPGNTVSLGLFLHLGTAVSAIVYYRSAISAVVISIIKQWQGGAATAPTVFYFVATLVSGLVGIGCYALLQEVVSALTGGTVVIIISLLLITMGVFQRVSTGTLLLRGYEGFDAFRFSFVLSIPAAVGGGLIAALDSGLQGLTPIQALAAFLMAAVVGYLSMDVLLRLVDRIALRAVCLGLGTLAVIGGVIVV